MAPSFQSWKLKEMGANGIQSLDRYQAHGAMVGAERVHQPGLRVGRASFRESMQKGFGGTFDLLDEYLAKA